MQRPPLFEANCFIYWKNHFETYVKSKDIDLWYIIAHGNYKPTIKDKDGKDVVTPYEKLDENQKKMLSKNDEAKMEILEGSSIEMATKGNGDRRIQRLVKAISSELVGNLKVYEVILEKDLEIAKNKKEKYKSLALKAKQVLSDDDKSSSDSNDEEYAMAEERREDRRCFKCGDPNHFISNCPKNSSGDQKAFVVGSWSDSGDDSNKEEICLMAHSNEVLSDNLYYSSSSLDNESRENKYDKLGQISLRIIIKNKHLKAENESLKKTINELKTKIDILEKGKETSSNCDACNELRLEVNSLKLKLASFENSSSSLQKMVEMQKPSKDKCGLGYTETIASSRNTKIKNLGDQLKKLSVEPACRCHSSTAPACSNEQHRLSDDSAEKKEDLETNVRQKVKLDPDEWIQDSGCTRHMTGNKDLFSSYKPFDGGNVLFGSNTKSKIIGKAFCDANGITYNFSALRTPQSNRVVERKNRTLQEMSRTLLNEQSIPQKFWCNSIDTSTYILNRILIRLFLGKTPYELFKGRKTNLEYFKVFGSKCFILNTKDYLTKFDPKSTECVFLGYSPNSKAYAVLNKETMKVEESLNVMFDQNPPPSSPPLVDDDLLEVVIIENQSKDLEVKENETLNKQISNIKESKDHPLETIIGNLNQRTLSSQVQNQSNFFCFVSSVEPKNIKEAIQDESWTMAMQEELTQFKTNDVWCLVPPPKNQTIIGTKWVFKNKVDENGVISRNKARLVAQGCNQQEEIDFDETYAPVARLESIRILFVYACAHDFKLFQMDVKSAFLNGFINEEVTSSPPYQPFSPPSDYTSGAPPTSPIISPPLSPIKINSNENCLLTPKSTPPPLTTPPPAPTQPSKLTSPVAINLDPIELLFSTPPSSPSLLDVLGDLPPSTTNPSPPRPSFATIERLANEPPPIPPINSTFPLPTPEIEPTPPPLPPHCLPPPPSQLLPLLPLGPNNPLPLLTYEIKAKENLIRLHKISQDFANQNSDFVTVCRCPLSTAPEEPAYSEFVGYKYQSISHVIALHKKGIAKYAKVSSTPQKCLDLDSSYLIQEIILLFNTIITSLKALDESFSSRNHVRKFLRALPSKWRPKVTAIEESKDLSKLSLDELVGNLKVYEVVLEKDLEIAKNKKEKDFKKKFFRRWRQFVRQPYDDKKNFQKIKEEKREDRRCFKCGDPNHFISDCPKNYSGEQKAFVVGSWSDSGDDSRQEERDYVLMGHSNDGTYR
ncbi:retrovirus-related pol polyprotein from transposon TNT 1-94 [Tanacetum coccineum]